MRGPWLDRSCPPAIVSAHGPRLPVLALMVALVAPSGMDALRAAVEKARAKGSVVVQVERDGVLRYVAVPVD